MTWLTKLGLAALLLTLLVFVSGVLISKALEPTPYGPAIAPNPSTYSGPVVQVYGADVWGFRGNFAIHTWVATKAERAKHYTIYQVIGWRQRRHQSVVSIAQGRPNKPWFRSPPILLHEVKGSEARELIEKIEQAVEDYPYAEEYTMWPGPNSNSFVQWIALSVPQLALELPAKAIGKDWMTDNYPSR